MGRNLNDFFDAMMRHGGPHIGRHYWSPSGGFSVDSKGQAEVVPHEGVIKELLEHHEQGYHEYDSGVNSVDVQFSRRYCPKCQETDNA